MTEAQEAPVAGGSMPEAGVRAGAKASAIIVAAGRSSRMGGRDKLFVEVAGKPLLYHTLAAFDACRSINHIMLVLSRDAAEPALALLARSRFQKVDGTCAGGSTRQESVRAGLNALRACEWAVVHDGARPLVTPGLIEAGIAAARESGAAVAGLPVVDTVKEADSTGAILWTVPRERLWVVQTPQVFRYDLLLAAHEQQGLEATDDAGLVERLGIRVRLYPGSAQNLKVTTADDLTLAEALLRYRSSL